IGLSEPMEREVVARLAPAGPGAAFGTWHAISGLTALPAAAGTAWLWEVHGPLAAFGTSATLIAAALVAARRV
ncbi:MAG TPA: MFS transporter, partial [Myxococcota bacterium]|nr:MFS transporter [Myxococcota bacterium]